MVNSKEFNPIALTLPNWRSMAGFAKVRTENSPDCFKDTGRGERW